MSLFHRSYPLAQVWTLAIFMVLVLACASAAIDSGDQGSNDPSAEDGASLENAANQPATPTRVLPPKEDSQLAMSDREIGGSVGDLAPEFIGIKNWINAEPIKISDLRGKVVLVDVWTYTCINCIRTFPFLRDWHERYADDGLVIIGLHSPEFDFEKITDNVVQAANQNGIVWPVAQDNNMVTWRAYDNRFWPAKYLIDSDGVIRYTHFGEGSYGETESAIRQLLKEAGADLTDDEYEMPQDQARDPTFDKMLETEPMLVEVTPELYAGYQRNFSAVQFGSDPYVVQTEYYKNRNSVASFEVPAELVPHKVYFNGEWMVGSERAKHGRMTENYEDYIAILYSAKTVNAVITSDSGEPYRVRITMDGEYLSDENKGADVQIAEDGESYILVNEPRLYAIVDNPSYVMRKELRIHPNSKDFGLFAYTFGVYEQGP